MHIELPVTTAHDAAAARWLDDAQTLTLSPQAEARQVPGTCSGAERLQCTPAADAGLALTLTF